MARSVILARLLSQAMVSRRILTSPPYQHLTLQSLSTTIHEKRVGPNVVVTQTGGVVGASPSSSRVGEIEKTDDGDELNAKSGSKGTIEDIEIDDDDDEMEQEDMFVDAHPTFEFQGKEWGGPRRGGKLLEPTRYGDWERKGRCSDF